MERRPCDLWRLSADSAAPPYGKNKRIKTGCILDLVSLASYRQSIGRWEISLTVRIHGSETTAALADGNYDSTSMRESASIPASSTNRLETGSVLSCIEFRRSAGSTAKFFLLLPCLVRLRRGFIEDCAPTVSISSTRAAHIAGDWFWLLLFAALLLIYILFCTGVRSPAMQVNLLKQRKMPNAPRKTHAGSFEKKKTNRRTK